MYNHLHTSQKNVGNGMLCVYLGRHSHEAKIKINVAAVVVHYFLPSYLHVCGKIPEAVRNSFPEWQRFNEDV